MSEEAEPAGLGRHPAVGDAAGVFQAGGPQGRARRRRRGAGWKAELLASAGARVEVLCAGAFRQARRDRRAGARPSRSSAADGEPKTSSAPRSRSWTRAKLDGGDRLSRRRAGGGGAIVNVIDRPEFCDFSFGTLVNRSPLVVAISTDGAAPVFAQAIRARLEALLPMSFAKWAEAAREWRRRVADLGLDFRQRRTFWERFAELALRGGAKRPDSRRFRRAGGRARRQRDDRRGADLAGRRRAGRSRPSHPESGARLADGRRSHVRSISRRRARSISRAARRRASMSASGQGRPRQAKRRSRRK